MMMKQRLVCATLPLLALVSAAGPVRAMEGRAWGDIHVQTLDGATYEFQAAGEFVASRSTAGDLEVQLRLESTGFSNYVSIATAVAVLVDTSRASVALGREPMLSVEETAGDAVARRRPRSTRRGADRALEARVRDSSGATARVCSSRSARGTSMPS